MRVFSLCAEGGVVLDFRCFIIVFITMLFTIYFFSVYDSYDQVLEIDCPARNFSCQKNKAVRTPCTAIYKDWFVTGFNVKVTGLIISQGYLEYKSTFVNNPVYLRLSGYLSTDKIVQGNDKWALARLLLIFYDHEHNRLDVRHEVCQMIGTHEFEHCEQTFEVPFSAVDVAVQVVNAAAAGAITIEMLKLEVVEESPINFYVQSFFLFAWLILAVVCIGWLGLCEQKLGWVVLLLATFIVIGVLLPEGVIKLVASEFRSELSDVGEFFPDYSDEIASSDNVRHDHVNNDQSAEILGLSDWVGFLKSSGHIGVFVLLSFFAYLMTFFRPQCYPVNNFLCNGSSPYRQRLI